MKIKVRQTFTSIDCNTVLWATLSWFDGEYSKMSGSKEQCYSCQLMSWQILLYPLLASLLGIQEYCWLKERFFYSLDVCTLQSKLYTSVNIYCKAQPMAQPPKFALSLLFNNFARGDGVPRSPSAHT